MKRVILAAVLCLLTNVSFATFFDGNYLYTQLQDCQKFKNGDKTFDNYFGCGFANGYIMGVFDTITTSMVIKDCTPNITDQQVIDVVHLYLKNYPAKRSYTGEFLVRLAVQDAWPCPEE